MLQTMADVFSLRIRWCPARICYESKRDRGTGPWAQCPQDSFPARKVAPPSQESPRFGHLEARVECVLAASVSQLILQNITILQGS